MGGVPLLGPPDIRYNMNRVVGGDTEPSVPLTSHVFGNKRKTVDLAVFGCLGALMGSPWVAGK